LEKIQRCCRCASPAAPAGLRLGKIEIAVAALFWLPNTGPPLQTNQISTLSQLFPLLWPARGWKKIYNCCCRAFLAARPACG